MHTHSSKLWRQHCGLSFVEFVGCLAAMTGGVVLGSMYLGVDVQKMAVGMLEQAQVVQRGYFDQSTAQATHDQSELGANAADAAVEVLETHPDPTIESESNDTAEVQSLASPPAQPAPTLEEQRAATRTYWNQLTAIMLNEARGRTRPVDHPQEWQLYDFLTQRKKGHEQSLEALNALEPFAVDERLLTHGEQVVAWHQSGIKLFERALSLLSDGPNAKLSGPFAQSWQSSATQLRMEEKLVIDRHNGLANYLDREYPEEAPFKPAFAK